MLPILMDKKDSFFNIMLRAFVYVCSTVYTLIEEMFYNLSCL